MRSDVLGGGVSKTQKRIAAVESGGVTKDRPERRRLRPKNPLLDRMASRLRARIVAGAATDEALSRTMSQFIQSFDPKTGELNVALCKFFSRPRGAPIGNSNRVTHGKRMRVMKELRTEVRAHIDRGRALVKTFYARTTR